MRSDRSIFESGTASHAAGSRAGAKYPALEYPALEYPALDVGERSWALVQAESAAHGGGRPRRLRGAFRYGSALGFVFVFVVGEQGLPDRTTLLSPNPDVVPAGRRSNAQRLPLMAAEANLPPAPATGGTSDDVTEVSGRPDRSAARERRAARREARREAAQARREAGQARREQMRARRQEATEARREAALARREARRMRRGDATDTPRETTESRHAAALTRREELRSRRQEAVEARRDAALARKEARQQRREDAAQARRDAVQARRDAKQARSGGGSGRTGTLRINSRPWAEVFVDDRRIGYTPQLDLSVTPGAHRVRLVNRSFGMQKSFAVDVKAGERVSRVELLED